jgi:hypothetical protein
LTNKFAAFIDAPKTWLGQISAANASLDGSGTLASIATGGPNGSRIDLVRIDAIVTTTAGMWRLYLYDGTNTRLIKEITVSANTKSATNPAYSAEWVPTSPIILTNSSWILKASTENAEAASVIAVGGDY